MKKCFPFFHKYKTVYREEKKLFEGAHYIDLVPSEYIRCSKCNFYKEYTFDFNGIIYKRGLDKEKSKILDSIIEWRDGKYIIPLSNN
jgi:hypothetical protein